MRIIKKALTAEKKDGYFSVPCDVCEIRLWFLTDEIIRIRAGFDGDFDETEYALVMTAWEERTDDLFRRERKRVRTAEAEITSSDKASIVITGRKLAVVLHKEPFYFSVYDEEGTLLHEDTPGLSFREDMNGRRLHTSRLDESDHFYGFGETTGAIDKKETVLRINSGDSLGYDPERTDGLYKSIPFYIRLSEETKKAVGYYYHNTSSCTFNMGRERKNYWGRFSTFSADAGDVDLFLIAGPSIRDVVRRYTDLTGKSAMLPKTALGYLGSSMYYAEIPERADEAILHFTETAENEGFMMSGFQLSSGYCEIPTREGEKRCTFTWNKERFPDPEMFFRKMTERGIRVSANVKPGFLLCHPLYDEMKEQGLFVRKAGKEEPETGAWWGGPGSFADLTDPKNRELWKGYLKKNLLACGCTSVWNDNCEYDSLADLDAEVSYEGRGSDIRTSKPVMANLMCLLSNEAMEETFPGLRPFSVCRAGMPGIQRYAQVWTGDNRTGWDSLKYNIATMLGLGLSGVANCGSDVGGFYGPAPDRELFVRWVQNGIFIPRFSIHSANTDNTVTEPWMYREAAPLIREAFRLRQQLMPYFISLMYRAHTEGLPYLQPLVMCFQDDPGVLNEGVDFMLGNALYVANVVEPGAESRTIRFPEGADFYDFKTGEHYTGGQTVRIPVTLSDIPLFLVSGAVLPLSFREKEGDADLCLSVVPDRDSCFTLYEDDGETTRYLDGEYLKTEILVKGYTDKDKTAVLTFKKSGKWSPEGRRIIVDMAAPYSAPFAVTVDKEALPGFIYRKAFEKAERGWYYDMDRRAVQIKYNEPKKDYRAAVSFSANDLIGM